MADHRRHLTWRDVEILCSDEPGKMEEGGAVFGRDLRGRQGEHVSRMNVTNVLAVLSVRSSEAGKETTTIKWRV